MMNGIREKDFIFFGEVRYATTNQGTVHWKQGYLLFCPTSRKGAWECRVHFRAKDVVPAATFHVTSRTLKKIPLSPEKAEKNGFISFEFTNSSVVWIRKFRNNGQQSSFYDLAKFLQNIKNGCFEDRGSPKQRMYAPAENHFKSRSPNNRSGNSNGNAYRSSPGKIGNRDGFNNFTPYRSQGVNVHRLESYDNEAVVYGDSCAHSNFYTDMEGSKLWNGYIDSTANGNCGKFQSLSERKRWSPRQERERQNQNFSPHRNDCATSPRRLVKQRLVFHERNYSSRSLRFEQLLREDNSRQTYGQGQKSQEDIDKENTRRMDRKTYSNNHYNTNNASRYINNSRTRSKKFFTDENPVGEKHFNSSKFYNSNRSHNDFEASRAPLKSLTSNSSTSHQKRLSLSQLPQSPKRVKSASDTKDGFSTKTGLERKPKSLAGFVNIGNSCYMNSVLQALFGVSCFVSDFKEVEKKLGNAVPEKSLFWAMASLLHCKLSQMGSPESQQNLLEQVKDAVCSTAPWFLGNDQHDAHEFLGQVLDQLKEEIDKFYSDCDISEMDSLNPVCRNFEFEMLNSYLCQKCEDIIPKKEKFYILSVDLPKGFDTSIPASLQDAVDTYFLPEKFEFSCEKCRGKDAKCLERFHRLPRVLVIHLKRYGFDHYSLKVAVPVIIPKFITLQNHVTDTVVDPTGIVNDSIIVEEEVQNRVIVLDNTEDEDAEISVEKEKIIVPSSNDETQEDDEESKKDIQKHDLLNLKKGEENSVIVENVHKADTDLPTSLITKFYDAIGPVINVEPEPVWNRQCAVVGLRGGREDPSIPELPAAASTPVKEAPDTTEHAMEQSPIKDQANEEKELEEALESSLLDAKYREEEEFRKAIENSIQDATCSGNVDEEGRNINMEKTCEKVWLLRSKEEKEEMEKNLELGHLPYSYQLCAIVSHVGRTAQSGHYLCDVYDFSQKQWWYYNDDVVKERTSEEVLGDRQTTGYMFFYVAKCGEPRRKKILSRK
ncbi:ubiquitin carboxyl-terminal hydrolase 37-like isoform X2 [Tachypleus tridentatus]|uniref:ubiquitin carboxyl-terminal hydrolase 37-like isoform X2 n=1 Tax=Tachypleus tridentatus TaxID=6853 RepID=UPI003FCFE858